MKPKMTDDGNPGWEVNTRTDMDFVFDDGGRAAAGFKGKTDDCVCRVSTGSIHGESVTCSVRL